LFEERLDVICWSTLPTIADAPGKCDAVGMLLVAASGEPIATSGATVPLKKK
jgi:hypothetical protein